MAQPESPPGSLPGGSLTVPPQRRRPEPVPVELARLGPALGALVRGVAGRPADLDLVRARFADGCRMLRLAPLPAAGFEAALEGALGYPEAGQHLALAVELVLAAELAPWAGALARRIGVEGVLRRGLLGFVAATRPVLLADALEAPVRLEELARRFLACLGVPLAGETPEQSEARLEAIDSARLAGRVERAKAGGAGERERLAGLVVVGVDPRLGRE